MRRRTVLQWFGALAATVRGWGQAAGEVTGLSAAQAGKLRELAGVVLPSSLGRAGCEKIAAQFAEYVAEYRPGADTEHGYGVTRVRPKPPSPAIEYGTQLAALPSPLSKEAVAAALQHADVKDIPRIPDGKNVIADFMSFYYRSADANDLCYRAAIKRDTCRGLAGSSKAPAELKERA